MRRGAPDSVRLDGVARLGDRGTVGMSFRTWFIALLTAAAPSQEAAVAKSIAVHVEVEYPTDRGALRDHAAHLTTLQRRHYDAGLRITVTMPAAAATRFGAPVPPFLLTAREGIARNKLVVLGLPALSEWEAREPDVVEDLVAASLRPDATEHLARMGAAWRYVASKLSDGPGMRHGTARLVELFPHCGYAHAARYIDLVWYRADAAAARAAAETSLGALAGDSWPLVRFCDLVLRADANDRELAAKVCKALEPVIAAEPDAPLARLCSLRARLRADPAAVTPATIDALLPLVDGDGEATRTLAEIVTHAPDPAPFRNVAERLLGALQELPVDPRLLTATQYLVAARCNQDESAAAQVLERFIGDGKDDRRSYSLNTLAWNLLVGLDTIGRFDALALALMQKAHDQLGDKMSDALLDTMALAMFGNGRFDEAIELQQKAIANTDGDPRYECRLLRYQRTRDAARR